MAQQQGETVHKVTLEEGQEKGSQLYSTDKCVHSSAAESYRQARAIRDKLSTSTLVLHKEKARTPHLACRQPPREAPLIGGLGRACYFLVQGRLRRPREAPLFGCSPHVQSRALRV